MTKQQILYCDYQNCKFYYNNSPNNLGCQLEDNMEINFQIDEEDINLQLCPCFKHK